MFVNAHDHLNHYDYLDKALVMIEEKEILTLAVSEEVDDYLNIPDHPLILKGFGIHPWQVSRETSLEGLEAYLDDCDFIGEVGLDFHWVDNRDLDDKQREVLNFFLKEAKKRHKLTNLHTKGAEEELLGLLENYGLREQIVHWYSGPLDLVPAYLALDSYFTISVDVGHSKLTDQLIRMVPLERLLTETDGPSALAWVVSEDGYPDQVVHVLNYIAQVKGVDTCLVKAQIFKNIQKLFS